MKTVAAREAQEFPMRYFARSDVPEILRFNATASAP
jgi:hypothetical protein